jgi:hypothetical protein
MANATKQALRNSKSTAAKAPAKEAAKGKEAPKTETLELKGSIATVVKGKKNVGETVKVFMTAKGRFNKPIARAELEDGTIAWFQQDHLERVVAMEDADMKRLTEKQAAENDEVLYVPCNVVATNDAGTACRISYSGWIAEVWVPMSMIAKTGAHDDDAAKTPLYELPAWKVRKAGGADSYDKLKGLQAKYEKLVNAAS